MVTQKGIKCHPKELLKIFLKILKMIKLQSKAEDLGLYTRSELTDKLTN